MKKVLKKGRAIQPSLIFFLLLVLGDGDMVKDKNHLACRWLKLSFSDVVPVYSIYKAVKCIGFVLGYCWLWAVLMQR